MAKGRFPDERLSVGSGIHMNWLQKLSANILKATYDINTPKGKVTITILVDRQQFDYWHNHKNIMKWNREDPNKQIAIEPDVTLIIEQEDSNWMPDEPDPPNILDLSPEEREKDDVFGQMGRLLSQTERDKVDTLTKWGDLYPDIQHYFEYHFKNFPQIQDIYNQLSIALFDLKENIFQQYVKGKE